MKKLYMMAMGFASLFCIAQQTISFENSENFNLGTIHNQNGWEVTLNGNNQPIQNQAISNEFASAGNQSLKIAVDPDEDYGWFPIFGAAKELSPSLNYNNLNLEFDVFISELEGSTFEFGTYGIVADEFVPVFVYSFNYTGNLELVSSADYDYQNANFTWEANKWYKLKVEIRENSIKYYIDGNLVFTGENFSKTNIEGLNFVHDNFGGAAYIDNIKLNNVELSVQSIKNKKLVTYPNPVKDILKIEIPQGEKIASIEVYNVVGQKVAQFADQKEISLYSLKSGLYIVKVLTDKESTYTTKIIKE
ncbi:T9SS type A sorting domain-containing protein [Kaistella flava (ex Peng et al. 2021)]|uniref:T9SS type A sorting domain-containing protein n=1 Tax=Kaistella flava (ex Peng et al. 2021) TaxID=2038776 RepID=A0A7M2YA12_9FLAO|nr:T9SS type A sorting domain-containing protein [Kaistella flava (ex Peng et al. 2021)]QOW10485.1 T9SS type A sorting domain-containing protein [Kaistella flava (ex Peng et al. 2021)]